MKEYSCKDLEGITKYEKWKFTREVVQIIKWAEAHIPICPSCREKFEVK